MALCFRRAATLSIATCILGAAVARADLDIYCTVIRGNIVVIKVFHEDQVPAKGLKVALVDAQKNEIAAGKINADGEWSWPAPAAGAYEFVLDPGTGNKDITHCPVTVRQTAVPSPEPDPDRVRCDHCPPPAPVAAATPPPPAEPPLFPWMPALGVVAVCGAVRLWFGKSWLRPWSPPPAIGE
jgi:hypothetical protein